MYKLNFIILVLSIIASISSGAPSQQDIEVIDLAWPLENKTLHWPTIPGFEQKVYHDGEAFSKEANQSYYYKSDGFSMGAHVGTHLDAPKHFSNTSWTVDEISLQRMVDIPIVLFDLSNQVLNNRSYCFKRADFIGKTSQESFDGKVVIVYTGMSAMYKDGRQEYFGTNSTDYTKMRIPGFSKEAAEHLAELGAYGVGLDSASADCSKRHDTPTTLNPEAHTIFSSKNMFILENLNHKVKDLFRQKAEGYRLTIIPLRIKGGSGSPVRPIVTFKNQVSNSTCPACPRSSAWTFKPSNHYLVVTLLTIIAVFYRTLNMST